MGGSGAQGTEETEDDEMTPAVAEAVSSSLRLEETTPGNNKQDIGSKGFDDETDVLSVCHFLSELKDRMLGRKGMNPLGPYYNYSDELIYPSEIPIRRDGDIMSGPWAIMKNATAVQYYVNAMGTGTSVGATRAYPEMA